MAAEFQDELISRQQRMSRRRLLAYAGAIGIGSGLAALAACTPSAPAPSAPPTPAPAGQPTIAPAVQPTAAPAAQSKPTTQGGTLIVAGEAVGDNFVPMVGFQGWAHSWIYSNVCECLYSFRDMKTLVPTLATSHTVSSDGLTYTFQLRKDVKFHDGTPFNAEAVEFNYMRYLDKDHPYYEANAIGRTSALPGVKSVKATDEYVVQIVREKPMSAFIAAIAAPIAGILSPTAIKKVGVADAGRHPIGTGSFAFERGEKGNQAIMRVFTDHWAGRPSLDRIVVRAIADERAMTASLLSGEVDMTPFVDFKDLESFRNNPNLNVQTVPAASTGYMGINKLHEVTKDVRARQAIAHAVNKQQIIDTIFYGEADLGGGLTSIPMWAHAPQFKDYYKYDPQKARDLLSAAGGSADLTVYTQTTGFWPRMAELMQAGFNEVGFRTKIERVDSARFYQFVTEGEHALFIGDGTHSSPDPEELMWIFFGCNNPRHKRWGYCDPAFDELMAAQASEIDQEKRKETLWQMQKMLLDEAVQVPNYYNRFATVANKRVEGFSPLPIRIMFFDKTYVTRS